MLFALDENSFLGISLTINGQIIEQKELRDPNQRRYNTSLCNLDNRYVFAIGGYGDAEEQQMCLDSLEYYNIQQNKWQNGPKLNTPRAYSSSCSTGNNFIYTFCGYNYTDSSLDTIEKVDANGVISKTQGVQWQLITLASDMKITARYNALVAQFSRAEIVILGGYNFSNLEDGYLMDTTNDQVEKLFDRADGLKFSSDGNQTVKVKDGQIAALI